MKYQNFLFFTLSFALTFSSMFAPNYSFSQSSSTGSSGSGSGGGGGGGGQNLYGFRYIITPTAAYRKGSIRYALVEKRLLATLRQLMKIKGYDFLKKDSVYTFHDSAVTTYSYYENTSSGPVHHSGYYKTPKDSVVKKYLDVPIHYVTIKATRYHHLDVALLSRSQDTCMLEIWPPSRKIQNDSDYAESATIIDTFANKRLWGDENGRGADTFYLIPPWTHAGATPRYQSFNLLFQTHYLIPVSIPIVYATGTRQVTANFLNAGVAYGWGYGRTKFYRDNIVPARNFYFGAGLIGAVTTVSLSSQNVPDTAVAAKITKAGGVTYPGVYGGIHVAVSFNSIQLMGVAGMEWTFGRYQSEWANQHRIFIGLGIGLSIFNLVIPSASSNSGSH